MKNIAIFIPSLKAGGAEKQATLLATVLDKHYNVDMYLLYGDGEAAPQNIELLRKTNVVIHSLDGTLWSKIHKLKLFLKENKTDVLLNYLTSCDVIGAIAGRFAGVDRIYGGIRNARVEWTKMVADKIAHNLIATGSVYNCYSGAEYFTSKGYKANRNTVIPNCFLNIADSIIRIDKSIKDIVTVGRFVPQKDYLTIIKTIAKLKDVRHDFMMNIIGYGVEEENIRGWIEEYGVEKYINIHIRPDNVQEIVKDSDIYLSTSLFEGTSNSIMEALNWSLPVVATNVGDNDHLVIDGETGFLHLIGDAENLAHSLAKLLESSELRNQMGIKGNKNLRDNYSMEIFEKRYLELIEG